MVESCQKSRTEVLPFFSCFADFHALSRQLSGSGMICAWRSDSAKTKLISGHRMYLTMAQADLLLGNPAQISLHHHPFEATRQNV
jgi:hypothetical protein